MTPEDKLTVYAFVVTLATSAWFVAIMRTMEVL